MHIGGMMNLTLLDYPGLCACTVFFSGCDLRCPFCHNARLVKGLEGDMTDRVKEYLEKRKGILDGVCITGGEPLMQGDLEDFVKYVRGLGLKVKLDTNGTYPDRLKSFLDRGLIDYVAMDIKASPEDYPKLCGCKVDIGGILESINVIRCSGADFEFRTTAVKGLHTRESIVEAARLAGDSKYYLQNFKDSGDTLGGSFEGFERQELEDMISEIKSFNPKACLRG